MQRIGWTRTRTVGARAIVLVRTCSRACSGSRVRVLRFARVPAINAKRAEDRKGRRGSGGPERGRSVLARSDAGQLQSRSVRTGERVEIVVELEAVDRIHAVHRAQTLACPRAGTSGSGCSSTSTFDCFEMASHERSCRPPETPKNKWRGQRGRAKQPRDTRKPERSRGHHPPAFGSTRSSATFAVLCALCVKCWNTCEPARAEHPHTGAIARAPSARVRGHPILCDLRGPLRALR